MISLRRGVVLLLLALPAAAAQPRPAIELHIVPTPKGFPLSPADLVTLRRLAGKVASAFRSRLVVADFARGVDNRWWFIEAGPGSCAGTGHEAVFKAVARRLGAKRLSWRATRWADCCLPINLLSWRPSSAYSLSG